MSYDYLEAIKADIRGYIKDEEISPADFDDADEMKESVEEACWTEDSVTGNGASGYTGLDRDKQESEMLDGNLSVLLDALRDFGEIVTPAMMDPYGIHSSDSDKEYVDIEYLTDLSKADITIRCWYLNRAVNEVIDEDYSDDDFDDDDDDSDE